MNKDKRPGTPAAPNPRGIDSRSPGKESRDRSHTSFGDLEPMCRQTLWNDGISRDVAAGELLCREGDECRYLPLVVSGSIRIFKTAENGREVTLYSVAPGSSCVLSAAGILKGLPFPARAVAESDTRVLLVPKNTVTDLYEKHRGWRDFILSLYTDRVLSVIHLVEEVLFRRLDERLFEFITDRADDKGNLVITHQKIAEELGSTREVISRLLKDLENRGTISQQRGKITLQQ